MYIHILANGADEMYIHILANGTDEMYIMAAKNFVAPVAVSSSLEYTSLRISSVRRGVWSISENMY